MVAADAALAVAADSAQRRSLRWKRLAIAALTVLVAIAVLNAIGVSPLPGRSLVPDGDAGNGHFTSGLLPAAGRDPGKAWVALVSVHNFGSSSIALTGASADDLLPGTDVLAITVNSHAGMECTTVSFDASCVATAVASGKVADQTLVPGEDTFLMVVAVGPGSFSGFENVHIGYRTGALSYTEEVRQGAWVCVGVPTDTCPADPWPGE